jgi:hypothetical protein
MLAVLACGRTGFEGQPVDGAQSEPVDANFEATDIDAINSDVVDAGIVDAALPDADIPDVNVPDATPRVCAPVQYSTDFSSSAGWWIFWEVPQFLNPSSAFISQGVGILRPGSTDSTAWSGMRSPGGDFRGRMVAIEFPQMVNTAEPVTVFFGLDNNGGGTPYVRFHQQAGVLSFDYHDGGSVVARDTVPFDPQQHRFWQVRENAGTTYWETSADGNDYVALFQIATPPVISNSIISLGAGTVSYVDQPGEAHADNLEDCVAN